MSDQVYSAIPAGSDDVESSAPVQKISAASGPRDSMRRRFCKVLLIIVACIALARAICCLQKMMVSRHQRYSHKESVRHHQYGGHHWQQEGYQGRHGDQGRHGRHHRHSHGYHHPPSEESLDLSLSGSSSSSSLGHHWKQGGNGHQDRHGRHHRHRYHPSSSSSSSSDESLDFSLSGPSSSSSSSSSSSNSSDGISDSTSDSTSDTSSDTSSDSTSDTSSDTSSDSTSESEDLPLTIDNFEMSLEDDIDDTFADWDEDAAANKEDVTVDRSDDDFVTYYKYDKLGEPIDSTTVLYKDIVADKTTNLDSEKDVILAIDEIAREEEEAPVRRSLFRKQ